MQFEFCGAVELVTRRDGWTRNLHHTSCPAAGERKRQEYREVSRKWKVRDDHTEPSTDTYWQSRHEPKLITGKKLHVVRRVVKVWACLQVLISMCAWDLLVAASFLEHNRHLVWIVSQSGESALLRPPYHSCAVVAVLTLHHRKAEVAGASQVRTEIIYVRYIL